MLAGLSCCCHATAATGLSTNSRRRQCCTASELWFVLTLRPSPSTAMAPLRLRATTLAAVLRQTSQPRSDDLCCLPSTRTRPRCCHGCAGRKARWVPWRERAGQDLGQARFICAARCAAVCFAFRATLACDLSFVAYVRRSAHLWPWPGRLPQSSRCSRRRSRATRSFR